MARVMNVVFGIGIAALLFILVMLGIQVFYSEPVYGDYCNISYYSKPLIASDFSFCPDNMSVGECRLAIKTNQTLYEQEQKEQERCNTEFEKASKIYGKNLFIVNNFAGIIAIVASLFLFGLINIAAGTAFAGLMLIIYGFMRGWQGTGDILKFVVALIVTSLFIYLAVKVNKRYSKENRRKK